MTSYKYHTQNQTINIDPSRETDRRHRPVPAVTAIFTFFANGKETSLSMKTFESVLRVLFSLPAIRAINSCSGNFQQMTVVVCT